MKYGAFQLQFSDNSVGDLLGWVPYQKLAIARREIHTAMDLTPHAEDCDGRNNLPPTKPTKPP